MWVGRLRLAQKSSSLHPADVAAAPYGGILARPVSQSLSLAGSPYEGLDPTPRRTDEMAQLTSSERKHQIWSVVRVSSGNFLEMYDFFVFGYYASAIGKAFFPTRKRFRAIDAGVHDVRRRLPDAAARRHLPRRLYRPLRPPRRPDADARFDGGRNDIDRARSGLCDDRRAGAGDRRDRPADPGRFRRRRTRRGFGLSRRNRHAGPQGFLCQLAIRQPADRRHFRRAARRRAERDRAARPRCSSGAGAFRF